MAVDFKRAAPEDVETLMGLIRQLYEADSAIASPLHEEEERAALEQLLRDPDLGRVWLIQDGGEAIGYLVLAFSFSLEFRGRNAFLDEFYVVPRHQNQGIGTRALAFMEEECRSLDIRALRLEVERANTRARALYRRAGFGDHDRSLMTQWIESD